ncbi:MAG: glycosyltransferase family 4 protein [Candidatus Omnitrophica bacterium]|nr:glycosyltransferase family 4 protein [Candidatus Omnitrophota bacterium]
MKRILFVITESWYIGGAQRSVACLIEGLDKSEFELELACGKGGPLIERLKDKIKIRIVPSLVRNFHPLKDIVAFVSLLLIIRRKKFEIVHTHSTKAGILGRLAAHLCGVPLIIHTFHGFGFEVETSLIKRFVFYCVEKFFSRITDIYIVVGRGLCKYLGKFCAEKLKIIYHGIDFKALDARKNKEDLGIDSEKFCIGFVGRIERQKGIPYLLEAIRILKSYRKDFIVLVVGSGRLLEKMKKLAKRKGIEDMVLFLGHRDDTIELMRCMDIFVLPSLSEGVPYVILEAMFLKKAIVATDVGGISEFIQNEKTGILVKPKDHLGIYQGIRRLMEDKSLSLRLGEEANKAVYPKMAIEKMIEEYQNLYLKQ